MSEYYNVTTNAGDAAIATAIANNNKLNITHVAFGDGNGSVPTPNKTRSSLVHEVHRQAVTKYAKHPSIANFIIIETIIPSDIGGFWIREMGIIADNVLISHGSHAPFFKVADPEGVSEYRLKFTQDVRDGSVVEIVLDESLIYASQAWVNENYIRRNELIDNLTTNDATKPLTAKQGKVLQDNKLDKTANAVSASKLLTARTISYSGAATGSVSFDGSANASCILTLANSGVAAGTYASTIQIPQISVNAAGQIIAISQQNIRSASVNQNGIVQLVDDLATDDASKALTARQGKKLQDEKAALAGATFTGEVISTSENSFRLKNSKRSVFWRQDINNLYLMKTADDDPNGTWDNTRPIMWELKNNKLFIGSDVEFQASAKGNLTGNADTASKLKTPRAINGVDFDGSQDVIVNIPYKGNISSNANANAALAPGQYSVSEWNDNPTGLYSYGVFIVYRAPNGAPIHQIYYAHADNGKGSVQVRQTWNADGTAFTDWKVLDNQFVAMGPKGILSNSQMPAWTDMSGVYQINDSGSSRTVVHFKSGGSTSAFQLLSEYANKGLWYRTSRDSVGFENDFQKILTNTGNQSINGNLTLTDTINISFPDSIGAFKKLIQADTSTDGGYLAVGNAGSDKGFVELGTIDDSETSIVVRKRNGSNTVLQEAYLLDLQGNTSFPGALTANNGITSNGSLALANQQASSGNGLSLYGGLSGGNGVLPSYGIAFGGTGTFGTYGHLDGDWATYFTMDGAARRGWIFKNLNTGVAASINSDGSMAVKNGYYLRSAGATSDFSQGSGIYTGTGDGADYSTHNVAIRSWWGIGFYNNGNTCKLVIDTRTGSISGRGQLNFGGDITSSAWMYAQKFVGSLGGNADTASKLQTARNIALSGAVSGSANFDGSGNITINTTANNAIGVGQSWQDVTSSRARETTYTNTTGRPIQLFISVNVGGQGDDIGTFNIDGVVMTIRDATAWSHLSFIIPNGSSYKLSVNASQYNLLTWAELR